MEPVQYERVLRGIPLWLLREYLQELGGDVTADGVVEGLGWKVFLTQLEDYQIGSISVGQVRLQLQASAVVYEVFKPKLEKKLIRAGG